MALRARMLSDPEEEARREVKGVQSVVLVIFLFLGIYAMIYVMGITFGALAEVLPAGSVLVLGIVFAFPLTGFPLLYLYIYRRLKAGRVRDAMENAQSLTSVGLILGVLPGLAMYTIARRLERALADFPGGEETPESAS